LVRKIVREKVTKLFKQVLPNAKRCQNYDLCQHEVSDLRLLKYTRGINKKYLYKKRYSAEVKLVSLHMFVQSQIKMFNKDIIIYCRVINLDKCNTLIKMYVSKQTCRVSISELNFYTNIYAVANL
jgi:hypothetical protein